MKRIACFHSDVDFGMTTHLRALLQQPTHELRVAAVRGAVQGRRAQQVLREEVVAAVAQPACDLVVAMVARGVQEGRAGGGGLGLTDLR